MTDGGEDRIHISRNFGRHAQTWGRLRSFSSWDTFSAVRGATRVRMHAFAIPPVDHPRVLQDFKWQCARFMNGSDRSIRPYYCIRLADQGHGKSSSSRNFLAANFLHSITTCFREVFGRWIDRKREAQYNSHNCPAAAQKTEVSIIMHAYLQLSQRSFFRRAIQFRLCRWAILPIGPTANSYKIAGRMSHRPQPSGET